MDEMLRDPVAVATERLVEEAFERGSHDNIAVVIVMLKSYRTRAATPTTHATPTPYLSSPSCLTFGSP
jgi:serine/threonine protein phosphatase PrpC